MDFLLIMTCICILISFIAFLFEVRFNTHIFQLNGYKNKEQTAWLKKNIAVQISLCGFIILGLVDFFFYGYVSLSILSIFSLIEILYYLSLKKRKSKKKLVYTNRVKRLLVTNVLLYVLVLVIVGLFVNKQAMVAVMCLFTFLEPVLLIASNLLNSPIEKAINQYFINDAKRILQSNKTLKVIGVTGSYGKTSVKYYLQTLLSEHFNVLITPESYNTPMGVVKTIRSSLKSTHEIFVCEMGARYVGDIKEICDIVNPECGVITAIGPQHLETFGCIENIVNTKFELADAVQMKGMLVLNGDNEYIRNRGKKYKNAVFYNTDETHSGYKTKNITLSQNGTKFTVISPNGEEESFQTRLVGEHNIVNIVGAISVANMLGIPLKDLIIPVRRLQPVEHRMQMIKNGNVTIIDDAYNSNPVGSKAAVKTLSMFDGVKILVTPGMVELGKEEERYNFEFGKYAAEYCDYVILVGEKHTLPILKGLMDKNFSEEKFKTFEKITDAVSYAYSIPADKHKYILLENDLPDNY